MRAKLSQAPPQSQCATTLTVITKLTVTINVYVPTCATVVIQTFVVTLAPQQMPQSPITPHALLKKKLRPRVGPRGTDFKHDDETCRAVPSDKCCNTSNNITLMAHLDTTSHQQKHTRTKHNAHARYTLRHAPWWWP